MNERVLTIDQNWIALRKACLCLSCETIFEIEARSCPACGGSAMMPLLTWLHTVKEKP